MSADAFAKWWLEDHAPLARTLPGLKQAVFNLNRGTLDEDYDGVSELWFESEADFTKAYASEVGQRVAADSMANVAKRERLLVESHLVFSATDSSLN